MESELPDHRSIRTARQFASLGYSITFRRNGWWECLLVHGAERWIGSGTTRRQALESAAAAALPSHAARTLWERARAAARRAAPVHEVASAALAGDRAERPLPSAAPSRTPPPGADPATVPAVASPANGPAAAVATVTSPVVARDVVVLAPPPSRAAPASDSEVRPAARPSGRRIPPAEALALYAELEDDIDVALEEAGLFEPERQRLLLLSWISRARSIEGLAGGNDAFERTRAIARRLGRVAKIWWPGSVRALGIDALPADCAPEIPGSAASDFVSWGDVARAAEDALEAREADAGSGDRPLDEHGWAGAAAREPVHPRPDEEMAEVVAQIERLTVPLALPSGSEEAVPAFAAAVDPRTIDVAPLVVAVRKLRWLRGATSELELWGAAIGRLRWAASVLRVRGDPIARLLDPRYVPAVSWAQELRYDPDKKRRQKEKKALIATAGRPTPASSEAELRDWLRRALELGEVLPNDRIAGVLEEQAVMDAVLALDARTFSDRRSQRTRLEAIQRILRREPAATSSAPARPGVDEDEALNAGPSHLERILEPLLPVTRGRRVLFVSNRNDPAIDQRLCELFAFEEVDHCEVKSSNVAAKARSVEQGGYDMVLAATGFLSHSTEGAFRDAARRAQIPHVRVNRGRPLSVALALAREFGLRIPSGSTRSGR